MVLLPAVQYGDWSVVKKRMRGIITRVKRGKSLIAEMTSDGMFDTDETPGMLMLGGLMRTGWTNFHCFMPWRVLWQVLIDSRAKTSPPPGAMEAIFRESISVPWGVLGLLAMDSKPWFWGKEEWYEPFLQAAINAWDELDSVGARYYIALQGERLWSIPNSLHYVLGNMGVPHELLRAPLSPQGPRALLKHVRVAS